MAKKVGRLGWAAALIVTFLIYQAVSPSPFDLSFLGLQGVGGGDPVGNAYSVTIESFYQQSCTVLFQSSVGNMRKTFNPCKFTWGAASESTLLTVNTASRTSGRIQSRLVFQPFWQASCYPKACNAHFWDNPTYNGYGMKFQDWQQDDISWSLEIPPEKAFNKVNSNNVPISPSNIPASTGSATCMQACWQSSCDNGYGLPECVSNVIDSSRTFKLTTDNPFRTIRSKSTPTYAGTYHVTFEIINPNFYVQEAYYRTLIPAYPHYRQVDCPIFKNYTVVTEEFAAGKDITMASFRYPVNYFCESLPVLVLDTSHNLIATSPDYLQDLLAGKTVTVPAGDVYRIEYVVQANKELGLRCDLVNLTKNDDGSCPGAGRSVNATTCEVQPIINGTTGGCTTTAGLVHLCSAGSWVDSINGCVIQPVNDCPLGTVKKTNAEGVVECIQYLPVTQYCTTGDLWNVDKQGCCYNFQQVASCPSGQTTYANGQRVLSGDSYIIPTSTSGNISYNRNTDTCAYQRPLDPKCDVRQGENLLLGVQ